MNDSRPVVVGVDGSAQSIEALREAQSMAGYFGSPVKAVAVWTLHTGSGDLPEMVGFNPQKQAEERLDEALGHAFGNDRPEGLQTEVREGQPARVLTELSGNARLIVVGSRGRGGFAGLLLGSVSSVVGAHAKCPVLIMHGRAA